MHAAHCRHDCILLTLDSDSIAWMMSRVSPALKRMFLIRFQHHTINRNASLFILIIHTLDIFSGRLIIAAGAVIQARRPCCFEWRMLPDIVELHRFRHIQADDVITDIRDILHIRALFFTSRVQDACDCIARIRLRFFPLLDELFIHALKSFSFHERFTADRVCSVVTPPVFALGHKFLNRMEIRKDISFKTRPSSHEEVAAIAVRISNDRKAVIFRLEDNWRESFELCVVLLDIILIYFGE